jgi:hypothetical protein
MSSFNGGSTGGSAQGIFPTTSLAAVIKKLFKASAISEGFFNSTPFTTIQSTLLDF